MPTVVNIFTNTIIQYGSIPFDRSIPYLNLKPLEAIDDVNMI